jgi:signal transduction histidine kinase
MNNTLRRPSPDGSSAAGRTVVVVPVIQFVRAGPDCTSAWITVVDDGSGFDPGILQARAVEGHLGLRGLEGVPRDASRTRRFESELGRGNTVFVELPIG